MSERVKRWLFDLEDRLFAALHRVDLAGVVTREDLISDNQTSLEHATAYHAVWCRNIRQLLKEAKKLHATYVNFVDVGAGKGKACFFASRNSKFKRIIGIEFSLPLVKIARRNMERFANAPIEFQHSDALDYKLPAGDSIVFLFNPFDGVMMDTFLRNNLEHFRTYASVLAYANDRHRNVLAKLGFETVFRNQTRKISLFELAASEPGNLANR
jgi:SAM-dependent methyltransferase